MSKSISISLKAGERIYLNGAVIRVDRKASLEILNDVVFLLEAHVLQPDQTTTPLRQLYFSLQTTLMDPKNGAAGLMLFRQLFPTTLASFSNQTVVTALVGVLARVDGGQVFAAMRELRELFAIEDTILNGTARKSPQAA